MFQIGVHQSSAKGYRAMAEETKQLGATTLAFFTRNPRGGNVRPLDLEDMAAYRVIMDSIGLRHAVAHAPYTLNACAAKENLRTFAQNAMAEDLSRLEYLPGTYYNFHPGSHVKQGTDAAIPMIADVLNQVLRPEQSTLVLLETMAGKGSEVGRTFEELRAILDRVALQEKMGVCLDTCHVWDGGYDVVNRLDDVLAEFDSVIGLEQLKAVHLNESLNPCGSRKDRHARMGEGALGLDTIERIINHPALRDLPFIMETPNDTPGHAKEIALVKRLYHEKSSAS